MTRQTKYRFGFVLTTAAGNMTRYQNLRKYADRDPEVECIWAPVKHYLEPDPFRRLPGPLRSRAVVLREAAPVMAQMRQLDAVMFHAFEPYVLSVLRYGGAQKPLLVWSQDNPPLPGSGTLEPSYGGVHARSAARRRLRYRFDRWCTRRTGLFVPFSKWAGDILVGECGVTAQKVFPVHVGLDLEFWPFVPPPDSARPQILFVGGDFERKGGDLLLKVYSERFAGSADLHLVTKEPPAVLLPGVRVYTDLGPNDPRLRALYAEADVFVLPTRADVSSWVALEAMATGRPVISTRMGGIPDIVRHGETGFLIAPNDEAALGEPLEILLADPALRRQMGAAGRAVAERDFSAAVSVPCILNAMKDAVRER